MKLFVGNGTKQNFDFQYRIPESTGLRNQNIGIGKQVQISGDLTKEAVDAVVEQLRRYGGVATDEVDRTRDFTGYCYSVDKPVAVGKIEKLIHHNIGELVKMGQKIRREAAVSSSNSLETGLDEAGPNAPGVRNFEMSWVEENHDDRDETPAIAEGFRVSRGADEAAPRTQRRRR